MEKSRSLAILLLGAACILLIACQTGGTPKKSDATPTKSRTAAGPQEPPAAKSASQKRTAGQSGNLKSATSAKLKDLKREAPSRAGNPSRGVLGHKITVLKAVLYATLAVILLVVVGAIAAERVGRHRRLTPSSANARQ
jgi:hypothetical protein